MRNALAWVVVLAGFKPTPAEELDHLEKDMGAAQVVTDDKRTVQQPRAKSEAKPQADPNAKLSDGQKRILKARADSGQVTDEQIKAKFGMPLDDLPAGKFNDASAWIREMAEAAQ
jgi:hypothetical protein